MSVTSDEKKESQEQFAEEKQQREAQYQQSKSWIEQGLCCYCGGQIGGLFTKKCKSCGKKKDHAVDEKRLEQERLGITEQIRKGYSSIRFGGYDWQVLEVQDDRALLLSEKILEGKAYNSSYIKVTWEECTLRQFLNNEFYNKFNQADRNRIAQVCIVNNKNPWYGTDGGSNTNDYIFLLSLEEVVQYFGDSGQLSNRPGGNASWINDDFNNNRTAHHVDGMSSLWWLRSPGDYGDGAAGVGSSGNISVDGNDVNDVNGGVRPALWLNL